MINYKQSLLLRSKKGFSEILIILIALIVIASVGFTLYLNNSRNTSLVDTMPNKSTKPSSVEINNDWFKYTHDEGGFSFEHPRDIKSKVSGPFYDIDSEQGVIDRITFGNTEELFARYERESSDQLKFNVVVYKNSPSLGTSLEEFLTFYNEPFQDETVRKLYNPTSEYFTTPYQEGLYLYEDSKGLPPTIAAVFTNGETLVHLSVLTEGEKGDELFREIIQTFRFN